MSLSPEMTSYLTTGLCPYCHVRILSETYVPKNTGWLQSNARQLMKLDVENVLFYTYARPLVPSRGARAKITDYGSIQCLTCMETWSSASADEPSPRTSTRVDLSGCSLIRVKDERYVDIFLTPERNVYPNNSSGTVTQETSISHTITRTVTTESSKLTSYNAQAGITLVGFATIQGQVQKQLGQHYSVTLGSSSSISKKSSVSIPPYSSIEHVIQWKIVTCAGTALLGKRQAQSNRPPIIVAQIQYKVQLRLDFNHYYTDADPAKKKRKPS